RASNNKFREEADTAGVPSKRPVAGLRPRTPDRTHGQLRAGCHRWGWPRRLPLGVGWPAVPWLQCLLRFPATFETLTPPMPMGRTTWSVAIPHGGSSVVRSPPLAGVARRLPAAARH